MERNTHSAGRRSGYQNLMLTVIAGLLAAGLIDRGAAPELSPAAAQPQPEQDGGGLTNKLEQNKQIIAELRVLNSKIDRIESRLAGGLSVKVTDMPPIKLPPEARGKQAQADKPDAVEVKPASKPVAGAGGAADGK